MKKHLLASTAFVALAALAVPAAAEITVNAWIDYDKEVDIIENLTKDKHVNLHVNISALVGATAAEANAVTNQRIGPWDSTFQGPAPNPTTPPNTGANLSIYVAGTIFRAPADYYANTSTSVNDNVGITQYNQDVGVGANQANVLSAAVGLNTYFAEANNAAAQYVTNNVVEENGLQRGTQATLSDIRQANIVGSVSRNVGVVNVNQNAGVFNNQLNASSVAVAFGSPAGAVALAESDLGQWNLSNSTTESNSARTGLISNSGNLNRGVVMGNQAVGIMANQANMLSVSASVPFGTGATATNAFLNTMTPNF